MRKGFYQCVVLVAIVAADLGAAADSAVEAAVLAAFPVGAAVPIDHPAQAALVDTVIIIPEEAI